MINTVYAVVSNSRSSRSDEALTRPSTGNSFLERSAPIVPHVQRPSIRTQDQYEYKAMRVPRLVGLFLAVSSVSYDGKSDWSVVVDGRSMVRFCTAPTPYRLRTQPPASLQAMNDRVVTNNSSSPVRTAKHNYLTLHTDLCFQNPSRYLEIQ